MVYATLSDMLLDNRHGLKSQLEKFRAKEEVIEAALTAYDWVAQEMLKYEASHKIEIDEVKKLLDEEDMKLVEAYTAARFREIVTAVAPYLYDVKHGRKVGYSEAEEGLNE